MIKLKILIIFMLIFKYAVMDFTTKYGKTALIAGASEGIGAAFSDALAKAGMDLIMIARKKEPLENYASSLATRYNIKTQAISCDLSELQAAEQVKRSLDGIEIDMFVYNAALSFIGPFENDSSDHSNRIAVANMITPMNMTRIFGEEMLKRKRGAIILMASMAGFQGSGFLSVYASSKAFNRVFAESLWYEWKNKGVDVIACCAGATSTKNYLETNPADPGFFAPRVTTPGEVVKECLKNLGKRPSFLAGRGNRAASFFMQRILPRKMAVNIMGDNTRRIYNII